MALPALWDDVALQPSVAVVPVVLVLWVEVVLLGLFLFEGLVVLAVFVEAVLPGPPFVSAEPAEVVPVLHSHGVEHVCPCAALPIACPRSALVDCRDNTSSFAYVHCFRCDGFSRNLLGSASSTRMRSGDICRDDHA